MAALMAGCVSQSIAPLEDRSQTLRGVASDGAVVPTAGYHTVQKGETLYSIALMYHQDYREIAAWNSIVDPYIISVGQLLRVQPPEGAQTAPVAVSAPIEQRSLEASPLTENTPTLKRSPKVNKEAYSDEAYARAQPAAQTPAAGSAPTSLPQQPVETKPAQPSAAQASGLSWAWPASGKITGSFDKTKGIDIAGKAGDPILAASNGKVAYVGNALRNYGQLVVIQHNDNFITVYAHNQKILVTEKQTVKQGQKIAEMGNTGSDTIKLHFEIRRQGTPVEPLDFLPQR